MTTAQVAQVGAARRKALLRFLAAYTKKHGYGPSFQEIADEIGIGKTAVRYHLGVLADEGKVTWTVGRYRSLRTT